MKLPRIAVTMGDPTGIGPEIIVAAWSDANFHARCRPLVVGHPEILRRAAKLLGRNVAIIEIDSPDSAEPSPGALPCLVGCGDESVDAPPGKNDARGGQAAYDAMHLATELALAGRVDAIVTAPLSKAALWQAGHHYPGHTELLAELCGVKESAMMLYLAADAIPGRTRGLGVVHVTLHTSLRRAIETLDTNEIISKSRLIDDAMQRLDGAGNANQRPRIGVCALNPHAGEQGLFGDEEQTIIAPAVAACRDLGLLIEGPLPADTLMLHARDDRFDAVVAMYHDQGHIALKLISMQRAVNVTLGLPIIRTSVAHGTAHDIAWTGKADCQSLLEATAVAAGLARDSDDRV